MGMGEGAVSEYLDGGSLEELGYQRVEQDGNAVDLHNNDTGVTVSYADDTLYVRPWSDEWPSFNVRITDDHEYEIVEGSLDGAYDEARTFVENVFATENRRGIEDPVAEAQHRINGAYDDVRGADADTIAEKMAGLTVAMKEQLSEAGTVVKRATQSDPSTLRLHYGPEDTGGEGIESFEIGFDEDPKTATQIGYCIATILMHEGDRKPQINNGYKHKDHHQGSGGTPVTDAFERTFNEKQEYEDIRFHNSG